MKPTLQHLSHKLQNFLGMANQETSIALKSTGNKTKLIDVQRRIGIYLRALWDSDFPIKQSNVEFEYLKRYKPFIENDLIHLPNVYYDLMPDTMTLISGLDIYRAASAHAAAHIVYTKNSFPPDEIDAWQKMLISVIEDARVETLSIRKYPGLKPLWSTQHRATPANNETAGDYLNRLARALLDETYQDDDAWIEQGRELFNAADNLETNQMSWDIGVKLAHTFQQKKIKFNARLDRLSAPYRDDNRYIWSPAKSPDEDVPPAAYNYKSRLGITEVTWVEDDLKNKRVQTTVESEITASASETFLYPEWDYRSQIETQAWVTLREMDPKPGELKLIDDIIVENHHLISRMKNLLLAIRYGDVRRIRKLDEGDEVDINAVISAQIDIRLGVQPDSRIMMRSVRKTRDISVLALVDLSKSTTKKIQGQEHTVLQLTQQVCVLFANAIETVGDPFAIHGFCSETRHHVEYYRFKDFDQPYDDIPKVKIAGMTGQRNTRMGAAIRHATYYLNQQKSSKKLLMIITDGEPSDVDQHERKYLHLDTKKAVDAARHSGISTYCISLDPAADQYVTRIFGARNYMVVDHVKSLPEKILLLYATLTH
jgi:nitric oxide reductase NorD protein